MVLRVLHFLLGLALVGAGGYLALTHSGDVSVFPPGERGLPLALIGGLLGVSGGLVFLVSAPHPRPNRRRMAAEKVAREDAALVEAGAYYSERARAADRATNRANSPDWRAGDITPLAPAASPEPVPVPPPPSANPFPSAVTLAPLPRAAPPPPTAKPVITPGEPFPEIRSAIATGRLEEAERMLNAARDTATGLDLAHLTTLAAHHASASGKHSHARWLWRLALKRFGELDAINTPAALAVAESLRTAG